MKSLWKRTYVPDFISHSCKKREQNELTGVKYVL